MKLACSLPRGKKTFWYKKLSLSRGKMYCPSNGHIEIDWPEDSGYWMMGGTEEKKLCDESETNASEDGWTERLKR